MSNRLVGRGYIGAGTETTKLSGQAPDNPVDINHITVYVSRYTVTDRTGMLSPNNGRHSGTNNVGFLRGESLARYLLHTLGIPALLQGSTRML